MASSYSTLLGIAAIALWCLAFPFSRSLTEKLGTVAAAALVCLLAGAVGSVVSLLAGWYRRPFAALGVFKVVALGGLFAGYQIGMYLALGWATSRESFLAVTLINYLWPGMTIVLSVPLLRRSWRPSLILGLAMVVAGVAVGLFSGRGVSLADLQASLAANLVPYGIALFAALCWAVYSNLLGQWARDAGSGLLPFYILGAGLVLWAVGGFGAGAGKWSSGTLLELGVLSLVVTLLGYALWDLAMRWRRSEVVPALANAIPLGSVLVSGAYLGISLSWAILAGCALVAAGSAISMFSVGSATTAQDG